jgi:hypothetical protein
MRKRVLMALGLAIVLSGGQVAAQFKGIGRLNGKVVDADGAPIEGVAIKLRQGTDIIEGKTDAKGDWLLAGVARGNWLVSFDKEGFPSKLVKVVVEKEVLRTDPIKIQMKKGA